MLRRLHGRYEAVLAALPQLSFRPFAALRETRTSGYSKADLRADVLAGLVVGLVALPLAMALAIETGVPPQHGIYTAIVAGGLIALLGGSRFQVSGPTAAFVVILAPITARHGLGGLLIATVLAGIMLILLGVARLGQLIQFIPYPVTTGFTAGIAVVIAVLQLKNFLGLEVTSMPHDFVHRVGALAHALPSAHIADTLVGVGTIAVLLLWPRFTKKVPAPLIALGTSMLVTYLLARFVPSFHVATIGSRYSYVLDGVTLPGIPPLPPLPVLPWNLPGPNGAALHLDFETLRALMPSAFAIAMLGAIESLLSAVVADGLTGAKHDPDAELIAQGVGNIAAPFFGGFAATGAIARTATNIRSGARSPIAAIVHAVFLLAAVLLFAPVLGHLPMASLAALLIVVAWNMSEAKHFVHTLRVAPRSDVVVLLSCFGLTVVFDMVVAVVGGMLLALVLFMRRMAEISGTTLIHDPPATARGPLPSGVVLYEIAGPLFFGAAHKAASALGAVSNEVRVVVVDVANVPAMDATGLVNLESVLAKLEQQRIFVVICGVRPQPEAVLRQAGIVAVERVLAFAPTRDDGLALATDIVERMKSRPSWGAPEIDPKTAHP